MISVHYYSVVKFDKVRPHGLQHFDFGHFAKKLKHIPDIMAADVRISEERNTEIAKKYNLSISDLPVIRLVIPKSHFSRKYEGEMNHDAIRRWVMKETNIYIPGDDAIAELDDKAHEFILAMNSEERQKVYRNTHSDKFGIII